MDDLAIAAIRPIGGVGLHAERYAAQHGQVAMCHESAAIAIVGWAQRTDQGLDAGHEGFMWPDEFEHQGVSLKNCLSGGRAFALLPACVQEPLVLKSLIIVIDGTPPGGKAWYLNTRVGMLSKGGAFWLDNTYLPGRSPRLVMALSQRTLQAAWAQEQGVKRLLKGLSQSVGASMIDCSGPSCLDQGVAEGLSDE